MNTIWQRIDISFQSLSSKETDIFMCENEKQIISGMKGTVSLHLPWVPVLGNRDQPAQ